MIEIPSCLNVTVEAAEPSAAFLMFSQVDERHRERVRLYTTDVAISIHFDDVFVSKLVAAFSDRRRRELDGRVDRILRSIKATKPATAASRPSKSAERATESRVFDSASSVLRFALSHRLVRAECGDEVRAELGLERIPRLRLRGPFSTPPVLRERLVVEGGAERVCSPSSSSRQRRRAAYRISSASPWHAVSALSRIERIADGVAIRRITPSRLGARTPTRALARRKPVQIASGPLRRPLKSMRHRRNPHLPRGAAGAASLAMTRRQSASSSSGRTSESGRPRCPHDGGHARRPSTAPLAHTMVAQIPSA